MTVWDDAQAVLNENPQADTWNEAEAEVENIQEREARLSVLEDNPDKKVEDVVAPEDRETFESFFNLAADPDAERQRFIDSEMVSLSTGMPSSTANTLHSDLKANGVIDTIREERNPTELTDEQIGNLVAGPEIEANKRTGKFGRTIKGFINKAFLIPIRNIATKRGGLTVLSEQLNIAFDEIRVFNEMTEEDFDALTLKQKLELPTPPQSLQEQVDRFNRISEQAVQNVTDRQFILEVTPPGTIAEKGIEIATGVSAFIAKIALAKWILGGDPSTAKDILAFELVNQVDDGTPGAGALTAIGLKAINSVPFVKGAKDLFPAAPKTAAVVGRGSQLTSQGAFLAGITKAGGGSNEDALIAFFIPFALATTGAAKGLVTENAVGTFFRAKSPELFRNLTNKDVFRAWQISKDVTKVQSGKMSKAEFIKKNGADAINIIRKSKISVPDSTPAQQRAVTEIVKGTTPESITPISKIPTVGAVEPTGPPTTGRVTPEAEIKPLTPEQLAEVEGEVEKTSVEILRDKINNIGSGEKIANKLLEKALEKRDPDSIKRDPLQAAGDLLKAAGLDEANRRNELNTREIQLLNSFLSEKVANPSLTLTEFLDKKQEQLTRDISGKPAGEGKVSLTQEAKKFKTPKEFIDSQERVFTHETDADFTEFDINKVGTGQGQAFLGRGIYLKDKTAVFFGKFGENEIKGFLIPEANIYEVKDTPESEFRDNFVEYAVSKGLDGGLAEQRRKEGLSLNNLLPRDIFKRNPGIVDQLKADGFDGLLQGGELVIYNDKVLKTEQQLTDIFNKSQAPPTEAEDFVPPARPEDSLIDERRGILAVPANKRTPQQIGRLREIENTLVEARAEDFPPADLTDKARAKEVRDTTKAILDNPAYQAIAEGQEAIPDLTSRSFAVTKSEMSDIQARFEGRPEILKFFSIQEPGGISTTIDKVGQEFGLETFDEILDALELSVEAQGRENIVRDSALQEALESGDAELELLAKKLELLQDGEEASVVNAELRDLAEFREIPQEILDDFLVQAEGETDVQRRAKILKEIDREAKKPKRKVKKPEQEAIKKATDRAFKEQVPIFVVDKGNGKFSVTKTRPRKGDFTRVTPPAPGELTGKTERLTAGPTAEEVAESKKLKQQINIIARNKGFTKKKFDQIKIDTTSNEDGKGGTKRLTRMTIEQLRDVLKAIKRARPKVIGQKTVIKPKTERQIAMLRDNLTKAKLMNDEEWDNILAEETGGKQPKFISQKAFITQSQGRKVLSHMHDSAEKLRATESLNRAIEENPDIAIENEKLKPTPQVFGAKNPNRLLSMRYFIQRMADRTDTQLYHVWQDLVFTHQSLTRERRITLNSMEEMPGFTDIARSQEAMQRVSDYIASRSTLKGRPKSPTDITKEEIALAKRIQGIYKKYEFQARIGKFFQHIDDIKKIPQYQQDPKAFNLAADTYNTQGLDALLDYLRTQPWAVVSSGYEPMESTIRGISTHELPLVAVPKTHIKERGIEYAQQERSILQRTDSYMRQMDFLAFLQPKIKSLVRSTNEVLDQFEKPQDISGAMSTFLDNLKRTNNEDGLVEQAFRKFYSQAITTLVLADPIVKPLRNLAQNVSFSQDKKDFLDPRNKRLTEGEVEYLETFVHQDRVMMSDWAFVGEEPFDFPVIGQFRLGIDKLTKWVQRHTLYPGSDRINRTGSFWAKINRIKRAFNKKQSLAKKMQESRFSDMQKAEQELALGILARDGVDAMARYVAKTHTDNTHFLYAREQRSPAEQTKIGKMVLNLALFKRAALEKVILQLQKTVETGATFKQRRRAANVFVTIVASSILVNLLYKKLTGKERGAYDFIDFLKFDAGGLQLGAVDTITDIYNNMLDAVGGEVKALSALAIAIPKAADTFIPYYDLGLRFIEAYLGAENIDRIPFRKLRELIDKEYQSRGIQKVERSLIEKLQFAFAKGKPKEEDSKLPPRR